MIRMPQRTSDTHGEEPRNDDKSATRLYSRRKSLRVLAATGAGVGIGSSGLADSTFARKNPSSKGGLEPTDLDFDIKERYRPFDLLADNFVQLTDDFEEDSSTKSEVLAPAPENNAGDVSDGGDTLQVSGDSAYFNLFRSDTGQRAPFSTVTVKVESFSGSSGPEDTVFAGLVKDEENYVAAWYNNTKELTGIDVRVNGVLNTVGIEEATLDAPTTFAFVLNENLVTSLVKMDNADEDAGWRPLHRESVSEYIDMRDQSVLAEYNNGFGVRANPGGTIILDGVEAGYWGRAGIRDPHAVTYADGTPYIKDNKLYITFTQAGLGFFQQAHWGVFTLDLSDYTKFEQVGNLFFTRDGDGNVYGDHAGHIVYDKSAKQFIVSNSTWGDFQRNGSSVDINYAVVPKSENVLHGVNVINTQTLSVPREPLSTDSVGVWDPHIVRIRGQWYVAFVNAREFFDFFPALAVSEKRGEFTDLSLVGADTSKHQTEGPIMQQIGNEWYLLASSPEAERQNSNEYPIYDLNMNLVGFLDAPHPTNIPWPMVTPIPERGGTRWILPTFNSDQYYPDELGYGTHGDLFVMEANQITRGHQFPPRTPK